MVMIIDQGKEYSSYKRMAEKMDLKNWISDRYFESHIDEGKIAQVVAVRKDDSTCPSHLRILGVEFEVKKNIMVDEYSQPVLAVGFNATYTYTKQDLKSSEGIYSTTFEDGRTEELQGAAPVIVNADVSYSPTFGNYKPTLNAVISYFSDRIDAIGSGQLGNIVEKGVPTLNFVFKNDIGDNFEVNATAFNLLNPNIQYVRETDNGDIFVTSPNGKGIASYKRGINLSLQLKYKF
jgi:hypothetical protein